MSKSLDKESDGLTKILDNQLELQAFCKRFSSVEETKKTVEQTLKFVEIFNSKDNFYLVLQLLFNNGSNKSKRGRPAGSRNVVQPPRKDSTQAPKRGPGRPPGSGKFRQIMWDVLNKSRNNIQEFIADYTANMKGLKASEIKQIIESEGVWKSVSPNISLMIQNQMIQFVESGIVVRNDSDKRYIVVQDAKLD